MKNSKIIIPLLTLLIIITISIIYNTLPRLQLNGPQNITLSYREDYEEQGVIIKNATGNYTSKIKIDKNIDTKKIGNYYIDYSLKLGAKTLHVRRNVKIIDDINPVIELKGEQITKISINKEYIEPGYRALDEYDGEITDKVQIIGEIDTEKYGEYILTYKVTDNSNNQTEVNRIIKVIDEIQPKITCTTDEIIIKKDEKIEIPCKAQDNYDGDITKNIKIIGEYDINTPGIYEIKIQVVDAAGNEAIHDGKIIVEQ